MKNSATLTGGPPHSAASSHSTLPVEALHQAAAAGRGGPPKGGGDGPRLHAVGWGWLARRTAGFLAGSGRAGIGRPASPIPAVQLGRSRGAWVDGRRGRKLHAASSAHWLASLPAGKSLDPNSAAARAYGLKPDLFARECSQGKAMFGCDWENMASLQIAAGLLRRAWAGGCCWCGGRVAVWHPAMALQALRAPESWLWGCT